MKKIFLFLAVASTAVFTSCSSDDNSDGGGAVAATSIVLASNVTAIEVGQSATFTVTDNLNNIVTGSSTFMANDVALTSPTFTATTAGTFTVKATYKNSKNVVLTSNPVTITVTAVAAANKYTFGGADYAIDNMYYIIDVNDSNNVKVFNVDIDGETVPCSQWIGVAYSGVSANLATAPRYYEYTFYVPVKVDATGNPTALNYPGQAESYVSDVYAENNLVSFDLTNVTDGTATFNSFVYADNTPTTTVNSTSFVNGATVVISHNFGGTLEGSTTNPTGVFAYNIPAGKSKSGGNKVMPTVKFNSAKVKFSMN